MNNLRPYQAKAVEDLRTAIANGARRPVLKLSVGAGKTRIAAEIINSALNKRKRAIFTVPRISLIDQTIRSFQHEGVSELGVIQQFHELTDPRMPVQIASIDTLMRREIPPADIIVVDEAHIQREFLSSWLGDPAWQRSVFIGLSATPWAKGMARLWDALVPGPSMGALIKQGYLSSFRVFAPAHPDLEGVKTRAGDYVESQLAERMNTQALVADVCETWLARGENRPTLCFGCDRAHAKHLAQRFEALGVPSAYVDCHTDLEERAAIEKRFRAGEVKVACSVGVLTTGIDWPVACIILARPTRSEQLFVQIVGRGLRVNEGWADCLILDHASIHAGGEHSLGFVTDLDETLNTLDDGTPAAKKQRKGNLPKECPKCQYLRPPKVAICPSCGHVAKHGPRDVACQDGELVEITAPRSRSKDSQRVWFAGLRYIARDRCYKPGWAARQFKEAFGRWPPRAWEGDLIHPPTPEVKNWVTSRRIKFAKEREKARATPMQLVDEWLSKGGASNAGI